MDMLLVLGTQKSYSLENASYFPELHKNFFHQAQKC